MTPERRKYLDGWAGEGTHVHELLTEIDALERERYVLDMQNKDYERVTKYLRDHACEREKTNQQLTTELVRLQAENEKLKELARMTVSAKELMQNLDVYCDRLFNNSLRPLWKVPCNGDGEPISDSVIAMGKENQKLRSRIEKLREALVKISMPVNTTFICIDIADQALAADESEAG